MENLHQLTYILLFFGITVWGQSIDTGVDFKQLSINDGLSHSDALTVTQDNYGFLWIGTNSGLNQYDGYQLTSYKWSPNDAKSIPGNRILKLLTTKDKIWLLIENQGLYYYDLLHYDFHLVKSLAQLGPSSYLFELDEKGHLWFFHQTTGLLTLTAKSALLPEDSLKKIAIKDYPLHLPELRQLVSTPRGKYFFDQTGRVYQYDEVTQQLTFQTFFDKGLFKAACQLNPSTLLVSCEKGLLRWHPNSDDVQSIKITEEVKPLALPTVTTIYTTEQTYYLGTTQGLYQGTFFKKQPFDQSDQLELKEIIPQVKVNQIFKDKYELLWVATSGHGLFYKNLRKLPFGHIRPSNSSATNTPSFRKNYTSAIFKEKDRPNELWIGSLAGLYLYDMPTKRYTTPIKALVDKHIRTIFQDSDGDLWVGTRESGLFRIRDKQLVRHYFKSETPRQSINSNHIVSVREDHLGNIWLASFDNGITIFNKKTNTFEPIFHEPYNQQSLGSNNLTYLYFHEKQQRMYVSSRDAGITIVDFDENDEFYYSHLAAAPNGEGLSLNYTWSIASNNGDTLYIGTIGGGLNVLKTQQNESGTYSYAFEHITKVEGLADNDVESVEMDQNGKIWMGGLGISTYNPNTKKIVNYDVEDGLQSNSFKIGASFFDDTANLLYFGGINGINFFHPNSIHPLTSPVDVQFVGLEILNTPVQVGEKINDRVLLTTRLSDSTHIRLQAEENQFTVLYKPLNFVNPQKNAVEYKLSPYQKDWIRETYPNQQASYTNLPHGNYTFQLRAVNEEGDAMSKVSTLSIYIEPYWYASNWAFSLYALLLAGLFYLYHRYLQITQANREKLAKAEKNQLLNQERLDFFTKISHEIRTPLTLIVGPIEDLIQGRQQLRPQKEVLQSISRHSHRLLHMVNKLLNFRKMDLGHEVLVATPTDLNEFVAEVFIFFKEKAYSRKIDYQFFNLPEAPMVYVDREKLETLLINLLSNAFKFTPSDGTIRIRLEMVGDERAAAIFNQQKEPILNYLRLSIEDSGTGIDPQKRDKIFNPYFQSESPTPFNANGSGIGLALVKSIVQLHHFKIDVADNKKSGGSTFSLRIPLGKAYLSPNELAKNASLASVTPSQAFVETPPFVANFQQSILKVADGITPVKKKLLVVEDHPDIQCYLREHLSQYFKILLAENGKIGFQLAKAEVPDLIISDVMMPEMNGMEMSKRLKTDEQLHHIPIILLTAITSTANELAGLRLGIEDYIRKPFNMELLLAKIGAILDNRQYVQEYYAKMLHFPPSSMNQLTEDDILLQKIIQLINNNLQNELLNVKFICSAMAMGRTKLYTKIKELTGRSIVELVRDIRLKKAGQQLRNTKDTIEQIAFGVGFNDVKYFRTHFKVMYGVNPSAYRKKEVSQ